MTMDGEARDIPREPDNTANCEDISLYGTGILDALDLPTFVISRDCKVLRVNPAATMAFSVKPSDIGRSPGDILGCVENFDRLCAQAMADGAPCRLETRDGDRYFLIRIGPFTAKDGQVAGAVVTLTNVTAFRASIDQAIYEREYTKAILNTVTRPLVVLDAGLRVQTANRAFYSMFGFSRDETQGTPLCNLGNSDWKASAIWQSLALMLAENADFRPVEIEREFPVVGRRAFLLDAHRISRQGNAMLLLGLQDVTEQKKSHEAVLQRTAQFQTLLNEAPLGVYVVDSDFRIREVNPTAYRAFGNVPGIIGRDFDEVIHFFWPKARADEVVAKFRHTLETGEPQVSPEFIEERRDLGVLEYYQWQINRISVPEGGHGVVCYFRDISSLVKARQEIEQKERHLRRLAETIPQLVWTCLPDGNCDYLSSQWITYTGIPEAEQLGLRWLDLVLHPDDRQRTYDAWMAAVQDGEPYDLEYRIKRFDGVYRCFRTRGTASRNAEGAVEKWFGTCTDIEDQKVAEHHMLEQQKRESLGLLAGGIAHDFNNLLVGVLGNASLID